MTPARLIALALLLALGACAEVTTFRRPDGTVYYHVDCGGTAKLESCRNAAERTCPGGYVRVPVVTGNANDPAARCAAENESRRTNGEAPQACPASTRRDSYFACK